MSAPRFARLDSRAVLGIGGPDRKAFLQGLVSNDVERVAPGRAVHAALLTPQGKYLHDFAIAELDDTLLIDCEAARRDDLYRRLRLYRLRSKVELAPRDDLAVFAVFPEAAAQFGLEPVAGAATAFAGGVAFVDPRLPALGLRALLPAAGGEAALGGTGMDRGSAEDYDAHRLAQGVPDGSRDLIVEKAILLENNFDELNAIDWKKGCYMGQELTARTRYRGLVRKRLLPVRIEGTVPEPGTAITLGEAAVGEMRSGVAGRGLALLRLEAVEKAMAEGIPLRAGDTALHPRRPDWLPEA